jgi:ABC-type Fe3+/spermidine/putrescine transport system ATPase subunit
MILRDFSLEVERGQFFSLLGSSGCGKTTTLRIIGGFLKPTSGDVLFDGERINDIPPYKRQLNTVFQKYALFPHLDVYDNIAFGLRTRKVPEEEIDRRVTEMLEVVSLKGFENRKVTSLSGGQQQRVALARMMVGRPRLLMLDGPFSARDSHLRFRMEQEVRQVIRRFGKTVLLVSHDRDEVYRMADKVALMNSGRIERTGTRMEVFSDPGTRNGCLLTGCKNVSAIRRIDGNRAEALDWGVMLAFPVKPGTDAVGIRMHDVRPGPGANAFRCKVAEVIENPFSFTVMLRPVNAGEGKTALGWEMEKTAWQKLAAEEITVHLPPERILQLKG